MSGSYSGVGLLSAPAREVCGGSFSLLCCTPLPMLGIWAFPASGPHAHAAEHPPDHISVRTFRERSLSREPVFHGEPWARLPG